MRAIQRNSQAKIRNNRVIRRSKIEFQNFNSIVLNIKKTRTLFFIIIEFYLRVLSDLFLNLEILPEKNI